MSNDKFALLVIWVLIIVPSGGLVLITPYYIGYAIIISAVISLGLVTFLLISHLEDDVINGLRADLRSTMLQVEELTVVAMQTNKEIVFDNEGGYHFLFDNGKKSSKI